MTRPTETRMSPLGRAVGEGAKLRRRVGGWKLYGLLAALLALVPAGVLAPMPVAGLAVALFVILAAFIVWRADT